MSRMSKSNNQNGEKDASRSSNQPSIQAFFHKTPAQDSQLFTIIGGNNSGWPTSSGSATHGHSSTYVTGDQMRSADRAEAKEQTFASSAVGQKSLSLRRKRSSQSLSARPAKVTVSSTSANPVPEPDAGPKMQRAMSITRKKSGISPFMAKPSASITGTEKQNEEISLADQSLVSPKLIRSISNPFAVNQQTQQTGTHPASADQTANGKEISVIRLLSSSDEESMCDERKEESFLKSSPSFVAETPPQLMPKKTLRLSRRTPLPTTKLSQKVKPVSESPSGSCCLLELYGLSGSSAGSNPTDKKSSQTKEVCTRNVSPDKKSVRSEIYSSTLDSSEGPRGHSVEAPSQSEGLNCSIGEDELLQLYGQITADDSFMEIPGKATDSLSPTLCGRKGEMVRTADVDFRVDKAGLQCHQKKDNSLMKDQLLGSDGKIGVEQTMNTSQVESDNSSAHDASPVDVVPACDNSLLALDDNDLDAMISALDMTPCKPAQGAALRSPPFKDGLPLSPACQLPRVIEVNAQSHTRMIPKQTPSLCKSYNPAQGVASSRLQRFLVLEVFQREVSIRNEVLTRKVLEKVLRLYDEKQNRECQCWLRDDWLLAEVEPGNIVSVTGVFDEESDVCLLSNNVDGFLVVHPDTLVSGTSVAMATRCPRRAVLAERFKGGGRGEVTDALILGVMLHELFDEALTLGNFHQSTLERLAKSILSKQDHLHVLYAADCSEADMLEKMLEQASVLQEWASKFYRKTPDPGRGMLNMSRVASVNEHKSSVCISRLLDIEENIWSPRFGLKGKVDATVEVKIHRQSNRPRTIQAGVSYPKDHEQVWSHVPLELKTGRMMSGHGSVEHRAQVILYNLMLSDCRKDDVMAGLLLYLKTGHMICVPTLAHETRALISRRNELARYLNLGSSGTSHWSLQCGTGLLPPMLRDQHTCQYCPHLSNCALLHRCVEGGTTESSGLGTLFDKNVEHLTPAQLKFYGQWYRLVGLEVACGSNEHNQQDIWSRDDVNQAGHGRVSGLVVMETEQQSGRHRVVFSMQESSSQLSSLSDSTLTHGDRIVVSETSGRLAVSLGFVDDVSPLTATVLVDRDLSAHRDGQPIVYRIDKDHSFSEGSALWANLAQLFCSPSDRDARLRSLVVELDPPRFARSSVLSTAAASQLPCTYSAAQLRASSASTEHMDEIEQILNRLNCDQQQAIDKVLCAQDYALILGMPGTGKTTTIAYLVQVLLLCGKSVLLASYTNNAVDNILLKLIESGIDFVRLGKGHKVHPAVSMFVPDISAAHCHSVKDLEQFYRTKCVMATTCHGIGHAVFARHSFDVCIVDEASQITLPMCLGPIRLAETFVLVGDQYQLPPLVRSHLARDGGLAVSLFRRLVERHPQAVVSLEHQYRMHQDIMLLSNTLVYSHRLKCGAQAVTHGTLALPHWDMLVKEKMKSDWSSWILRALQPSQPVVFLDTDKVPGTETSDNGLVYNNVEASLVAILAKELLQAGASISDIGIISVYRHQLKVIGLCLQEFDKLYDSVSVHLKDIEVNTVDRYQGRDKPCVIVSLVRSNNNQKIGELLTDWRRANVAITRAKHKLILVGSATTLRYSHLFRLLLDLVKSKNWIVNLPPGAHQLAMS